MSYQETILALVEALPFAIDPDLQLRGRPPTMASSQFLTNKEQGDWAEEIIFNAINARFTALTQPISKLRPTRLGGRASKKQNAPASTSPASSEKPL